MKPNQTLWLVLAAASPLIFSLGYAVNAWIDLGRLDSISDLVAVFWMIAVNVPCACLLMSALCYRNYILRKDKERTDFENHIAIREEWLRQRDIELMKLKDMQQRK